MSYYYATLGLLALLLLGCSADKNLRAPCDHYATFCGHKTPINAQAMG